MPEDKKPAFYELQLYAVKSANNIINNFIGADKSVLYKEQKRGGSVNKYAKISKNGYDAIQPDTDVYTGMLDGKWDKAINPFQTRLHISTDIKIGGAVSETVSELSYTDMGIAVENQQDINSDANLEFSGYTKDVRFIDIFNKGTGSFEWTAKSEADWIIFNKDSGTVYDDDRIYAGIDWNKAPEGISEAEIIVTEYIAQNAVKEKKISVKLNNDIKDIPEKTYAEANGYVSIEAEHYTQSVKNGEYEWIEQDDLGRSGTSMKFFPNVGESINDNSAYLEYDVMFENTGTFNVDVYRMPTLNEGGTVKFALGVDEEKPSVLSGTNKYSGKTDDKWALGVLNNNETLTTTVTVKEPGIHKIKLYGMDTGAVIDKIVVTTGEKYESFYGAPESYNSTYNNKPAVMPEASESTSEITGDITPIFVPTLHTVGFEENKNTVSSIDIIKIADDMNEAEITVAAYDACGIMTGCETVTGDFSNAQVNEKVNISVSFAVPEDTVEIQVIAYDNELNAVSPVFSKKQNTVSPMASFEDGIIELKSNLDRYAGKEALCVVKAEDTGEIIYIRQETVGDSTFKKIKTKDLDGTYDINIGVSGEGIVINEKAYTAENIEYDTEESTDVLYNWDFSDESQVSDSGNDVPVISGNAGYDEENQAIRMTTTDKSGGKLGVTLNEPLKTVQGQSITVVSKIAYGRQSNKYMDYVITDSDGNELIKSHISVYSSKGTIEIGGVNQEIDGMPDGIKQFNKDNNGINNGYTTYTTVLNPDTNTITLTVSNYDKNEKEYSTTFIGKFPENSSHDLGVLNFSTTQTYASRSCYVDDISISKTTSPAYIMEFCPENSDGEKIENADIVIVDSKYGVVILPEEDGTYKLCDGLYSYEVMADGYESVIGELELSQATPSKTVIVEMEKAE